MAPRKHCFVLFQTIQDGSRKAYVAKGSVARSVRRLNKTILDVTRQLHTSQVYRLLKGETVYATHKNFHVSCCENWAQLFAALGMDGGQRDALAALPLWVVPLGVL